LRKLWVRGGICILAIRSCIARSPAAEPLDLGLVRLGDADQLLMHREAVERRALAR